MPSEITYKDILLYKTEPCRNWDERGFCRYGKRCRYAHGKLELRDVTRSNQYKTKTCKAYHEGGSCPYGVRCTFIHHPSDDKLVVINQNNSLQTSNASSPVTTTVTPKLKTFSNIDFTLNTKNTNNNDGNIWDSKLGLSTLSNYKQPFCYQQDFTNYIDNNERIRLFHNDMGLFSPYTVSPPQNFIYDSTTTTMK